MSEDSFEEVAANLWLRAYPLRLLGADFRRNVTVIRLGSGRTVIHSTGPFSPADVTAIRELGEPGWILDGVLRHDTFAGAGREAFPKIPYLAPPGFGEIVGFETGALVPAPPEWDGELVTLEVGGMPSMRETVMLHVPSRTLIVTELLFNFGPGEDLWTKVLLWGAVGSDHNPGVSRPVKAGIKDRAAFQAAVVAILEWDFDRVIVGHGEVIESAGKEKLRAAVSAAGFEV